jgi:hypothetical protein
MIGFTPYQQEQEKMKYVALAQGRSPQQGMGYHGGGGGGGEPQPLSTNESRMQGAQADIVEEQAKKMRLENQGYGSATKDLMAQQQMANQITEADKTRQAQKDIAATYAGARVDAAAVGAGKKKDGGADIGAKIGEVTKMQEFSALPDNAKAALSNDPKVAEMINGNAEPIDILIYLATNYPGTSTFNEGSGITATNKKTGKSFSAPAEGNVGIGEY